MTHDQKTFAAILCATLLLTLTPHLFPRDLAKPLPVLPEMPSGCRADLVVGTLDCMTVFDDGTFIHTRAY